MMCGDACDSIRKIAEHTANAPGKELERAVGIIDRVRKDRQLQRAHHDLFLRVVRVVEIECSTAVLVNKVFPVGRYALDEKCAIEAWQPTPNDCHRCSAEGGKDKLVWPHATLLYRVTHNICELLFHCRLVCSRLVF